MKRTYQLDEIADVAREFAAQMGDGKIFAFAGTMGAGKTTFIKALCNELGVTEDVVNSPTFSIVNEYEGRDGVIYHFDFYRINKPQEAVDFGLFDYFSSGSLCVMEWAELIEGLLPEETVHVNIVENEEGLRVLEIKGTSKNSPNKKTMTK